MIWTTLEEGSTRNTLVGTRRLEPIDQLIDHIKKNKKNN